MATIFDLKQQAEEVGGVWVVDIHTYKGFRYSGLFWEEEKATGFIAEYARDRIDNDCEGMSDDEVVTLYFDEQYHTEEYYRMEFLEIQ